jgi:predicted nucleic-acid-binding Zn-ribbon protein
VDASHQEKADRMETMESPPQQYAPCPKCGGRRLMAPGRQFGLEFNSSNGLGCTNCGYVEFYTTRDSIEQLVQDQAYAEAQAAKKREKEMRRGR